MIGKCDLTAIRRPRRRIVKRRGKLDLLYITCAHLIADVQFVFTGFIGEVSDPASIGRPRRTALHDSGGVCEIARVTFFGGYGEDLAASLKDSARSRRRNRRARRSAADLLKMRAYAYQVTIDADADRVGLAVPQVVEM